METTRDGLWPVTRRDPVLLGCVASALALTVFYAFDLAGVRFQVVTFWVVQPILDVAFCALSWRLARLTAVPAATRRFWRLTTLAGGCFFAGDTIQAMISARNPTLASTNGGETQLVLVACGATVVIIAMLIHPVQVVGRDRLRFALDAATVMTGVAIFIWYFSVSTSAAEGRTTIGVVLAGPGLMLLCAFTLVKLVLGGNAPFTRAAGIAGGLSGGLVGIGTGLSPLIAGSTQGNLGLLARLLPCVLLVATPRIQELQLRAGPPGSGQRDRRRPYSLLPYAMVAAAQVLLVVALLDGPQSVRTWGVVAGVLVVTALVVIRQLVAFRDNADLLSQLDRSMLTVSRQEERFRSLVQHASDMTAVVDTNGHLTYASPAIKRMLGFDPESAIGTPVISIVHPDDRAAVRSAFAELVGAPESVRSCEARVRRADGSWRWLAVTGTNLLDLPSVGGIVCNARDITEIREFQDRLQFDATHDPLTGLANRTLFDQKLRAEGSATVLLIDLDDFKPVNDVLGHQVGDELLIAVAARLRRCVRKTDTVSRLGGDEFAVLTQDDDADGVQMAQRVLEAFAEPAQTSGGLLQIRASIGVAGGSTADTAELLRRADAAMYAAKRNGKNAYTTAPARLESTPR